MPEKRVSVIIPAYNEAKLIGGVLAPVMEAQRAGIVRDVIVVDDGSRDKTGKIAEKAGAEVIRLNQNVGKGGAFLAGLQRCRERGATTVVTLDADLLDLTAGHVRELAEMLDRPENRKKDMAICEYFEVREGTGAISVGNISGVRAIRMKALDFLFEGGERDATLKRRGPGRRFIEGSAGWKLEMALNEQFEAMGKLPSRFFLYRPKKPLRARWGMEGAAGGTQLEQMAKAQRMIAWRRSLAAEKWRRRHERPR